ncbi:outer membrane protein [Roseobacter ponti]|uniref:Porin family protein n=1 Tax=Roseobacter ponti TaxID=1891787 RepID=A0A858SQA9_9RHOB|nr:porin family protein [Roseobacter ponti]QJF50944.1 porin family protein [Roseobacter ponti]
MKRTYIAAALTGMTALTAPAFAGALEEPVVEAAPAAPVVQETSYGTWTGAYGGVQLGYGDVSGDGALDGVDGNDNLYGVHIGYNYDYGNWVSGIELDYDDADIDIGGGAATVDDVTRLKLKAGYDMGNWLPYATAGAAHADTTAGSDTGSFYGLGVSYQATERWLVGAEVLRHNFSDLGGTSGLDADADTFTVRASLRF